MNNHEEALRVLRAGRAFIAEPSGWTKEAFARNADGRGVYIWADDAVCFCSLGAISRGGEYEQSDARVNARRALEDSMGYKISIFNDTQTHDAVLDAWDRAIAKLEAA